MVQIIGARHIVRAGRGMASPIVELEVVGMPSDQMKFKTSQVGELIIMLIVGALLLLLLLLL